MPSPLHLKTTVLAAVFSNASDAELHALNDKLAKAAARGGLSERLSRMALAITRAAIDEKRRAASEAPLST